MNKKYHGPRPLEARLSNYKTTPKGCWEWQGFKSKCGYGRIAMGRRNGKPWTRSAHIVSFERAYGRVKPGAYICHHCDNPSCINPAHLYEGNAKTNVDDCIRRERYRNGLGSRIILKGQLEAILASKEGTRETAEKFGISISSVWRIRRYGRNAHSA